MINKVDFRKMSLEELEEKVSLMERLVPALEAMQKSYEKLQEQFEKQQEHFEELAELSESQMKLVKKLNVFEFTGKTMSYDGYTVYQIRAVCDLPRHNVKEGDIGGWISRRSNLSCDGKSWIEKDSIVYGLSEVKNGAIVSGKSVVKHSIIEDSEVCESTVVESKIRDFSDVDSSTFVNSTLSSAYVYNSSAKNTSLIESCVDDSTIVGNSEDIYVIECPTVSGSEITGSMVIRDEEIINKVISK